MRHALQQLLCLLTRRERLRLALVALAMLAMGIAQMLGVGVVLPFVKLLADPQYVHESAALQWLYTALGFASTRSFLLLIGSGLLFVLVASNAITAGTIYLMTRFAWSVQKSVSARLLQGYIHQPYETLLARNSADISKNILVETRQFANGVMIPLLKAMAFGITALLTQYGRQRPCETGYLDNSKPHVQTLLDESEERIVPGRSGSAGHGRSRHHDPTIPETRSAAENPSFRKRRQALSGSYPAGASRQPEPEAKTNHPPPRQRNSRREAKPRNPARIAA
jgi:hypothetical protein